MTHRPDRPRPRDVAEPPSPGECRNVIDPYGARSAVCPYCGSSSTRVESLYGSTISEAMFSCGACGTTFGWMKAEGQRAHGALAEPDRHRGEERV